MHYKLKSYALEKLDGADDRNKEYHIFTEQHDALCFDMIKLLITGRGAIP